MSAPRRSPRKHNVKSYKKDNGTKVNNYTRGSGVLIKQKNKTSLKPASGFTMRKQTDYITGESEAIFEISTGEGAIVEFDNMSAAINATHNSAFVDWIYNGMDADVSWGAERKAAQKDARLSAVDEKIVKHIIGVISGEGEDNEDADDEDTDD